MGHLRLCGASRQTISQEPCEPSQGLLANLPPEDSSILESPWLPETAQLIVRTQFLLSHKHLLHRAGKELGFYHVRIRGDPITEQ